jgi:hypothetical protein
LQYPPKFTQIGIFCLKIYHLATLIGLTQCAWVEKKENLNLCRNEKRHIRKQGCKATGKFLPEKK